MKIHIKDIVVFIVGYCIGTSVSYRTDHLETQSRLIEQPKLVKQSLVKYISETERNLNTTIKDKTETDFNDSGFPRVVSTSQCFPINPLFRAVPQYPKEAKEKKISGDVVIEVDIDNSGEVIKAKVLSGHPLLQETAIVAACKTTFVVSWSNNRPIPVNGVLTYRFRLD
ncbi:MAG: energy transducer TonB [Acidobacteria bacterium]|nr:energy transducer TonB [Acidobacteriota bacterium]